MASRFLTAFTAAAGLTGFGGAACAAPAALTARDFPVSGFDRIAVDASPDVRVTVGRAASVRAEGEAAQIERLRITVVGGELRVSMARRVHGHGWHRPLVVQVTAPALAAARVSGSGNVTVDRVEGRVFAATLDGSGNLRVGSVRTGVLNAATRGSGELRIERLTAHQANFTADGSGGISASGTAERESVSVSGSGDVDVRNVESRIAEVRVAGSGNAYARATQSADVAASGSGNAMVSGTAQCAVKTSGSGVVRCPG